VIAYLDCVGGLAGDMLLAACLDAGADLQVLNELPAQLGLDGVEVRAERVMRHGISAVHVDIVLPPTDRDGDRAGPRAWREIRGMLDAADLEATVRTRAIAVFEALAAAEAKIHDIAAADVHFHELGAADTLVDVCGAIALLDDLGVESLTCSPLPAGRGTIRSAHGVLPLPAPATLELLRGAPLEPVEIQGELVTPTGAALAVTLAASFGSLPAMTLESIGYGAGTADFTQRPNLLRLLLGIEQQAGTGEAVLLETNLDDLLPELVPDAVARAFRAGALDVWTVPAQMKKGRPGLVMSALARPADEVAVARAIFEETTALGIRTTRVRRHELEREERTVEVEGRPVRVKIGRLGGSVVNVAPEHDDCARVAAELGVPVKSVWAGALGRGMERT
jgi:pyridinium-3,5-bisthiocarboxylic acid mononucleotide nickel chelatase